MRVHRAWVHILVWSHPHVVGLCRGPSSSSGAVGMLVVHIPLIEGADKHSQTFDAAFNLEMLPSGSWGDGVCSCQISCSHHSGGCSKKLGITVKAVFSLDVAMVSDSTSAICWFKLNCSSDWFSHIEALGVVSLDVVAFSLKLFAGRIVLMQPGDLFACLELRITRALLFGPQSLPNWTHQW